GADRGGVGRGRQGGARRAVEADGQRYLGALWRQLVEPEDDVPGAGRQGAGDIAGGGVVGGDEEAVAGAARPAAEAFGRRVAGVARVEQPEIDDAVVGLLVGHGDVEAGGAGGEVDGYAIIGVAGLVGRGDAYRETLVHLATPSPALPTKGRVFDRGCGAIEYEPPDGTSPLVGEVGRGGCAENITASPPPPAGCGRRCRRRG